MATPIDIKDTPVKEEEDFLDEDPPLRGQKYVCLSFLNPSDVILKKDAWLLSRFIEHFAKDIDTLLNNLQETFPDFAGNVRTIRDRHAYLFRPEDMNEEFNQFHANNYRELEEKYFAENNFQPTVHGLKVRGVFETQKEANNRVAVLKKTDRKFNIFVGEVGMWLPWSPPSSAVENQEYMEKELQEMMKKYKENEDLKDHYFTTRKEMMLKTEPDTITPQVFTKNDAWIDAKSA